MVSNAIPLWGLIPSYVWVLDFFEKLGRYPFRTVANRLLAAATCASKGFPMGPQYGPLPSLKGSELWAPILKVFFTIVSRWLYMDSELGARTSH